MPPKIGDLLVQNGLIREEQLDQALQAQLVFGGRLGTNLVELGFITTATLAQFLATQLGMACLLPSQLTDVPQAVLDAVDPETASRYMVFPIAADRRTLHLAMADPTDLRAVDEVAFRTGFNVAPVVAPELLVVYALERFYHVKRANRFLRFTPTLNALAATLAEETPEEAAPRPRPGASDGAYGLHEAAADLVAAERNTTVLEVVQRYLREDFERVAIFVIDDQTARAFSQAGCTIPAEVIRDGVRNPLRTIEVPVDRSPLFRTALRSKAPSRDKLTAHREDRIVARLLELEADGPVLIFPVRLGERVEAVALGAAPRRPQALGEIQRYGLFASKVADAVRLVRLRKRILAV
jgi:hypothetical protein